MARQFVDGVKDVFVLGGVIRIEFFELVPQPGSQGKERPNLKPEATVTIAMPVEAFLKSVATLENVRNELNQQAGGVTKQANFPTSWS